jgi:hypothetical protein
VISSTQCVFTQSLAAVPTATDAIRASASGRPLALANANSKEAAMSRAGVGYIVDRLITDRRLRLRFAFDPVQTVVDLYLRGVDLSFDEIDLLSRADPRVWMPGEHVSAGTRH